jgi:hypothetical protein
MPKVSWPAFIDRHPAAHLVAGVLPEDEAATSNTRQQQSHGQADRPPGA